MKKYLEVSGTGVANAVPDRLDLTLSVTAVRPGVGEALAQVDAQVGQLGRVLREHGVGDADLRTTGTSVFEEYAGPDNARAGFRASHDLAVRVVALERLSDVVAAAVDAVGDDLRINQVSWGTAESGELVSRARAAAFEDARAKATELAGLAGAELGALLRVSESAGGYAPLAKLAVAGAGYAPEPGSSRIEITVQTRWALR